MFPVPTSPYRERWVLGRSRCVGVVGGAQEHVGEAEGRQRRDRAGRGALIASSTPGWAEASAPKPPRSLRIVPGNKQAKVSWVKPSNGGSPITQYEIAVYHDEVVLGIHVFKSTATTQVIEGLKNSSTYTFKVAAKNAVGWGKFSARSAPATIGVPSPPGKARRGRRARATRPFRGRRPPRTAVCP